MSARSRRIVAVCVSRSFRAAVSARFGLTSRDRRREAFARETRRACEELGPAFIKLGQLASVRPDVFSPQLVFELERLQDSVVPVESSRIHRVIAEEFGRETSRVFRSFDDRPIASASIAQVYRAVLADEYRATDGSTLPAGTDVAVKVVRPGIRRIISDDLAVARRWVRRLRWVPALKRLSLSGLLDEFEISLLGELDLRSEGRVADRFAFDFRDDPLVMTPRVVWPATSRRVLTTEFVDGWRVSDLDESSRSGVDAYSLAVHGAELFMQQVLVHGRYHADLHPANLFVTPDGRICYLDFGIVGHTEPRERIAIAHVLAATVYGDAERAIRYSRELGLVIPESDVDALTGRVRALLTETMRGPGSSDVRAFAIGFLSLLSEFRIRIPVGYGLLIKALVTVEGVARALYPEIDIAQAARPFATRLIAQELITPAHLAARLPAAVRAAMREIAR